MDGIKLELDRYIEIDGVYYNIDNDTFQCSDCGCRELDEYQTYISGGRRLCRACRPRSATVNETDAAPISSNQSISIATLQEAANFFRTVYPTQQLTAVFPTMYNADFRGGNDEDTYF